jgi:hypothetical protein
MDVANIQALIQRLRAPATQGHFDMGSYFRTDDDYVEEDDTPVAQSVHNCGTVACIAGHAAIMAHPEAPTNAFDMESYGGEDLHTIATTYLGLTELQASELFTPRYNGTRVDYAIVTAEQAAAVLENLIETGEVTWPDEVIE